MKNHHRTLLPLVTAGALLIGGSVGGNAVAQQRPTLQSLQGQINNVISNTYTKEEVDNLIAVNMGTAEDRQILAQVEEGIGLAAAAKAAVVDWFTYRGEAPANRKVAGMTENATDTAGNYVSAVNILNGRVDIVYGNLAHPAIAGKVLSLTPYESADLSVSWRCGNEPAAPGLQLLGTHLGANVASYTPSTVDSKYVPAGCFITVTPQVSNVIAFQVIDGLNLAASVKLTVMDVFAGTGTAPANRTAAGLSANPMDTAGNYVVSVNVINGRVDITYGNLANAAIAGKILSLTPYVSGGGGSVSWVCGNAPVPAGHQPMPGGTTSLPSPQVDNQYLPANCRP